MNSEQSSEPDSLSVFIPPRHGILVSHPHQASESLPLPATPRRCSGAGLGSFRQSDSIRGPRRTASPAPPRSVCLSRHESRLIPLDRMPPRGGYEVWPAVGWGTPFSPRLLLLHVQPAARWLARSLAFAPRGSGGIAIRLGLGACCPRAAARESCRLPGPHAAPCDLQVRARNGRLAILPGRTADRSAHPSPDPFQATVHRFPGQVRVRRSSLVEFELRVSACTVLRATVATRI